MPEQRQLAFSYQEVVEALVRKAGIHEGNWGLFVRFGLAAANLPTAPGPQFSPAAIIPIQEIGLVRQDETTNLTVDAATVNPLNAAHQPARQRKRTSRAKR
jgi:hypothetical protein